MVNFLKNRLVFYGQALERAREVGALSHTSRVVSEAVTAPIPALIAERAARGERRPLKVLEVGPGTGAITEVLLERLRPTDRLHLVEINPEFAKLLRETFGGLEAPRVTVDEADARRLPADARYDVITSSLPLLNMEPEVVREIFAVLLDRLAPDGTYAYYDYWGKEVRQFFHGGRERRRVKEVLRVTREVLDRHQVRERMIPWNFTPARVHYLRR